MWLYSILLLLSIAVPLALSFENKLSFSKKWKFVLPAIAIVALPYLAFDAYLTRLGVWGFNSLYHLDILIVGLPLEECLFFFVIPYACIFIHEAVVFSFPLIRLGRRITQILSLSLMVLLIGSIIMNFDRTYTVYSFGICLLALLLSLGERSGLLSRYFFTFLFILPPFIMVNAVLTGTFIGEEVVWYNHDENLGIRVLTIPVEDFSYAFSLVLLNLLVVSRLRRLFPSSPMQQS